MSDWLKVCEKLPEPDQLVIIFVPDGDPTRLIAKWDARNKTFDSSEGWFYQKEVTHWLPLQAAPKIVEDEPEELTCNACNDSGEGMAPDSRCDHCSPKRKRFYNEP